MTYVALQQAYTIRLRAISEYGPVIHEFDPYFNYRATEVRRTDTHTERDFDGIHVHHHNSLTHSY